jgi:uncharacterized protein YyaL (SSP411 family)
MSPNRAGPPFDAATLESAFSIFRRTFDSRLGGFGGAQVSARLRASLPAALLRRTKNREALDMALLTLREMARGGMNDQLGGGFHRYSVDDRWFVPHFEKMLYDQAQIAISYLEAFQATGDRQYADTARCIFDYVLRDMTDAGGGFYSAEDADSVIAPEHPDIKGEGAFYIWGIEEIRTPVEPACRGRGSATATASAKAPTSKAIRTASSPARTFSTRRTPSRRRRAISTGRPANCRPPSTRQAVSSWRLALTASVRTSTTRSSPPGTAS